MDKLLKFFENIVEVFSFLRIVISPLLIGCFIGIVIYANKTDDIGFFIGLLFVIIGLVVGVKLAMWARKNQGSATEFNAQVNSSRDIDDIIKKDKK